MGECAEQCATTQGISRSAQDEYALESTRRALEAWKAGAFKAEIVPVELEAKRGEKTVVAEDDGPERAAGQDPGPRRPAFQKDGTVTAANSSSINDGARGRRADERGTRRAERRTVLARIRGWGGARSRASRVHHRAGRRDQARSKKARLATKDIDLWEINEAFAVVSLANNRLLGLDAKGRQRARRRGRARSPHRRLRRAHPRDAPVRDAGPRQAARPRVSLHRRRRGGGARGRAMKGHA